MMDARSDLLTVKEVCKYLRKSPSTIYRLTRNGRLPGTKVGGTWLYSRMNLEELVKAHAPAATEQRLSNNKGSERC